MSYSPFIRREQNSLVIRSPGADEATAVAAIVDTSTTWANGDARLLSLRTGGSEMFRATAAGHFLFGTGGGARLGNLQDSTFDMAAAGTISVRSASTLVMELGGAGITPRGDLARTLGIVDSRWTETWSRRYATVEKVVTFSATPTFTGADGEHQQITMTANITSWAFTAGLAGEVVTIEFIQDATGSRTLAGTPANVLLAGGALTLTTTASKRDAITFRYNTAAAKWVEIGRSLNL